MHGLSPKYSNPLPNALTRGILYENYFYRMVIIMKRIISILLILVLAVSLCACSSEGSSTSLTNVCNTDPDDIIKMDRFEKIKTDKKIGHQLEMPEEGEEIAVVTTNYGTFKMRFFPEEAPKTVYNFKKLAQNGYYNGLTFHRVMANFMIQGGDPYGNGTGGNSIWMEQFDDEFSSNLFNITGSVAMANSGKDTNGSQFFVNYNKDELQWDYYQAVYDQYYLQSPDEFNAYYGGTVDTEKLTKEIKNLYNENGGNIHLDGKLNTNLKGHTVFAQVFEGLDVVEKISLVDTDNNNKPLSDVVIEMVNIVEYQP